MAVPVLASNRTVPTPAVVARRTRVFALPEMRWATAALVLFVAGLAVQVTGGPPGVWWGLYLVCYAAGGWEPGLVGLQALRDKTLDVDLLMVAAAIAAAAIGQVTDGALLIVIFATSGALEALATARTEDSVRGLLDLAPDTATRLGDGGEEAVKVADLEVGDVELFIEKVEQRYSIGMVVVTVAVFAIPLLAGDALRPALLRAMTFMIVASPCAVVLATMPPLLAAIANAGRHGVLVKSAVVMEQLGATTVIAFDKTGTLTRGTPELNEIRCVDARFTEEQLLCYAAAAEHPSEHPLAAAIVRAARSRGVELPAVDGFTAHPGRGVTARIGDRLVGVGSPAAGAQCAALSAAVDALRSRGLTAVVVTCDRRPVGVLGITDQLRPEAAAAVAATRRVTGTMPVLLTGDNQATADRLATQVGITEVHAGLLPDDKVTAVKQLQATGHNVTVVGDGINDAPALAVAQAGIAMGGAGSDLTLQTADAVVVGDDLATIPAVIALSRRARRVVAANLAVAAAGHEGSTVIVGLNGLRLLRRGAWSRG